jgi:hypothetical protein
MKHLKTTVTLTLTCRIISVSVLEHHSNHHKTHEPRAR